MDPFGTAMLLLTTQPELISSLNVTTGATVYFVNLTSDNGGGGAAVLGDNATMHIGAKARVVFMYNTADVVSGAVIMAYGMMTIGSESCVTFTYNHVMNSGSGAIYLIDGILIVDHEANLIFSHNSATYGSGGAVGLLNSTVHVNTNGIKFSDNRASFFFFFYNNFCIQCKES